MCFWKEGDAHGYHEESGYLLRVLKSSSGNAVAGFVSESSLRLNFFVISHHKLPSLCFFPVFFSTVMLKTE